MIDVVRESRFRVEEADADVSALLRRGTDARWLLVLSHGAGAGMRHAFMDAISEALAERRIATFRFQFPYTEAGSRRPSPRRMLLATIRAAVAAGAKAAPDLPLLAGGKSMGGRMTSLAASLKTLPDVRGIVFFGFPLHPTGKPSTERADHLAGVGPPMLFLQGTRDKLGELRLLEPICEGLTPRATLRIIDGADHSFHVLKRSGRSDPEVLAELADATAAWAEGLAAA